MNRHSQLRSFVPIAAGLLGIGAYQIISHIYHPAIMEKDFFRGIWFGVCLGLEITGIYHMSRRRRA